MLLLASALRGQKQAQARRFVSACARSLSMSKTSSTASSSPPPPSSSALSSPSSSPLFFSSRPPRPASLSPSPLLSSTTPFSLTFARGAKWSIETELGHTYRDPNEIIDDAAITRALETTKQKAKDPSAVAAVLEAAKERAFLKAAPPLPAPTTTSESVSSPSPLSSSSPLLPEPSPSEFVRGLSLEEAALLLNVDAYDAGAMAPIFDTALRIKERIYGNRVVLFAPLYIANYCVNSCRYCAFRCENKSIERSLLTDEQIRDEVRALELQGHRRLLVLTGEHPRYSFEQFLNALHVIADVRTPPCGNIRRMNVEIPSLSVSDMRRLKATDHVGTYTLFQETYHRPTFKEQHVRGPKSDYDHRLLTHDRAMRAGLDDVGVGVLFGLADYRYECLAIVQHAAHLEQEYGAGPHTISVPRMRHAEGSDVSDAPPHPVDDANFKKLVAILRIAVPYTGMILSTRESPEMRRELLKCGMSQMSAGSRTDVGAYHREGNMPETSAALSELSGQFSLADHRPMREIVMELLREGYVPSWCTACYRKGRTGEAFMKIAKAGKIHDFCHPNSLLTLKEWVDDYANAREGSDEAELIRSVLERESSSDELGAGAKRLLKRKMAKVESGERDVYV